MRLRCANRISIFLALTSRLFKTLGAGERPGDVSGVFADVAREIGGEGRHGSF
jgi:hypothetical protein